MWVEQSQKVAGAMGIWSRFSCHCSKIAPEREKYVMIRAFIIFLVVETIGLMVICGVSLSKVSWIGIDWVLPFDLMSMIIAVVILSLIILVTGYGAAVSNACFIWLVFHIFLGILLVVEIIICWFSADVSGFMRIAQKAWRDADEQERREMEQDLSCSSWDGVGDRSCRDVLQAAFTLIRNTTAICMFIDWVLVVFMDFVGYAICFHPDVMTLEQEIKEEGDSTTTIQGSMYSEISLQYAKVI
jgi:hypothetical protein